MDIPPISLEQFEFWYWFVIAALCVFLGFFVKGGFFPSFGLSALAVGGGAWAVPGLPPVFLIAGFGGLGVLVFMSTLIGGGSNSDSVLDLPEDEDGYVGSMYMLEQGTIGGETNLMIGDELWTVQLEKDEDEQPKGALVKVMKRSGTTLHVQAASDIQKVDG